LFVTLFGAEAKAQIAVIINTGRDKNTNQCLNYSTSQWSTSTSQLTKPEQTRFSRCHMH